MQSSRVLMPRLAVAAVVTLLACAAAAADESPEEFIKGLRARKMYDAVETYLLQLRDKPDLSPEWKQRIPYELGRTHVDKARQLPEADRLEELTKARAALDEFVQGNPKHALAGDALGLLGSVQLQRGAALWKASQEPDGTKDSAALREQARAAYQQALASYDELVEIREAGLAAFPKFIGPDDPEQRRARAGAQSQLIVARMLRATGVYESARAHDPDSQPRRQALETAAETFHEIYVEHRRLVAGLYAHMYEARCYQELGQQRRANGIYTELLALPDHPEVFASLKQRVRQMMEGDPESAAAPESP